MKRGRKIIDRGEEASLAHLSFTFSYKILLIIFYKVHSIFLETWRSLIREKCASALNHYPSFQRVLESACALGSQTVFSLTCFTYFYTVGFL